MASSSPFRVLLTLFLSLLLQSYSAVAANLQVHDSSFVPDVILRVTKIDASISCTQRESVVVNGTTPGPLVQLTAGQTTWVRVYNDMTDSNTTIHWHGLSASVAPFSDGTPLASQWPIAPQHYFDYELHPSANESGSYFYHSHVEFQTVSATGPLIVNEPQGQQCPYQYDDERIFFVTELYNRSDESIIEGLLGAPFVWSGESEAVLVNGQSTPAPNATGSSCAPEVFEVEPSKTYRFRFIGGVALADMLIVFENHTDFEIIAADAGYTKPYNVSRMQVDSGQRFDVLLKTKSLAELNNKTDYWIQLESAYRPTITTGHALLRYVNQSSCQGYCYTPGTARSTPPKISEKPSNLSSLIPPVGDNTTNTWLEYALHPLQDNNFPNASEVTRRLYLQSAQLQLANTEIPFTVNNHTWTAEILNSTYTNTPGHTPYLVDIYERGQSAVPSVASANQYYQAQLKNNSAALYEGWDPNFNAYPAELGEVIEIVLLNEAGFANTFDVHPWHAHGAHYYDLGSGPGTYDADANNAKLAELNAQSGYVPVLRDTTMLYRWPANDVVNDTEYTVSGWRAWRLRVTDPGAWMVHCHTLQHMTMGMQTVFVMGNASEITAHGLPESSGYDVYGQNVTGEPGAANGTADAARRDAGPAVPDMDGYLHYAGSAYGNAERAPLVNHHFA